MKLLQAIKGVEAVPLPGKTPDVTRAQVGGWLQFAASVAVATGQKPEVGAVIVGASGIVAFGIFLGDAIIRHGRAGAVAAVTGMGGPGAMGSTAPAGDEIPPSPTLEDNGDGTGSAPPPATADALRQDAVDAAQAAQATTTAFDRVEARRTAEEPPVVAPPPPPVPTPEEIAAAQDVLARAAQTPGQQQ